MTLGARRSRHTMKGVPIDAAGARAGDDGRQLEDHVSTNDVVVGGEDGRCTDHDDVVNRSMPTRVWRSCRASMACAVANLVPTPLIGGREQQLSAQQGRRVNHAADAGRAQDGRVVGGGDGALHRFDGAVARSGVDASGRVVQGVSVMGGAFRGARRGRAWVVGNNARGAGVASRA